MYNMMFLLPTPFDGPGFLLGNRPIHFMFLEVLEVGSLSMRSCCELLGDSDLDDMFKKWRFDYLLVLLAMIEADLFSWILPTFTCKRAEF